MKVFHFFLVALKIVLRQLGQRGCVALGAVFLIGGCHASPDMAHAAFSLRWAIEENEFSKATPQGRSKVQLTLTNTGRATLPSNGWTLYFNSIAGVDLRSAQGQFKIEQTTGTLFRIQPLPDFGALKPSESYQFVFFQPEVMLKLAKAPSGPYMVFDQYPRQALSISDYQKDIPSLSKQVAINAKGDSGLFTLQHQFDRNAIGIDLPEASLPPVFPRPLNAVQSSGFLTLKRMPQVFAEKGLKQEVLTLQKMLKPYFSTNLAVAKSPEKALPIRLQITPLSFSESPEAYEILVDPLTGIHIKGQTTVGVARAVQSLREMLPLRSARRLGLSLSAWHIQDAPRFAYRGLLMDVARNFQSKSDVIRLLDLMARYKLNKFHFHLSDDEGWRLEISGLPELTSYGARRGHGNEPFSYLSPAYGSGPNVSNLNGSGYYSQAEYLAILKHAKSLHIDVIPEIEMPGHSRAAVKAMRYRYDKLKATGSHLAQEFLLNDATDLSTYSSVQNYTDNVMDPGLASTYRFIEHVVEQLQSLHAQAGVPLKVLHVGGDELPAGAWHLSPAVAKIMRDHQIADFKGVWNYFYDHVHQILKSKGIQAAGWEELGTYRDPVGAMNKMQPNPHFLNRGVSLYVWNNLDDSADLANRLANAGYLTVLAPATALYFDMSHNANPEELGVNWASYVDLQTVFNFDPLDITRESPFKPPNAEGLEPLTPAGLSHILGIQGTLFSETVTSQSVMDNLLMPRMLALAERAWSPAVLLDKQSAGALTASHAKVWSVFVNQVGKKVLPKLDQELRGVQYRLAPPGVSVRQGQIHVNHELPGVQIRYTTDGLVPVASSTLLNSPLKHSGSFKLAAFTANGRSSRVVQVAAP